MGPYFFRGFLLDVMYEIFIRKLSVHHRITLDSNIVHVNDLSRLTLQPGNLLLSWYGLLCLAGKYDFNQ